MALKGKIERWIRQYLRVEPPRSKSLMVTIFGDSIAPRAQGLWLSELIQLMRPFHVNERLVRTTTFRLAEEGWLESQREGRRSRYLLTESGSQRIENAHRRIYDPPLRAWDGAWTVVILSSSGNRVAERAELRRELEWEGFGNLAPGIALHPCADREVLQSVLERLHLSKATMVLEARDIVAFTSMSSRALLAECWKLDELAALYDKFLSRFRQLPAALEMNPQTAFVVQTLLIHEYRRVVLRDPRLPAELLPDGWPGQAAYDLARAIYLETFELTNRYLSEQIAGGAARGVNKKIAERFGGLRRT